ncbi:response regulator [Pedobacter jeongneungensis]|uniref:response regulator n=1 Tax=Pedobacter jeongneungensis TaxID=947309 RepID=UPI000469439B|nr:response regulator [Pedobacter jeongneungensis]
MEVNDEKHQAPDIQLDVLVIGVADHKQLSGYLEEYDVTYNIAANRAEVIKKLSDFTFKLILIDMESPELEGNNIVELIKNDLLLNIPIVAIIADGEEKIKTGFFNKGISGCFTRPISKIELVGILTQFLQKEVSSCEHIQTRAYETIDLSYLREISMGDSDFEREMAEKFITIISDELIHLVNSLEKENYEELKRTVHKMKSTVYLMGLRPRLNLALESVEYDNLTQDEFKHHIDLIVSVCKKAKEEVCVFLDHSI